MVGGKKTTYKLSYTSMQTNLPFLEADWGFKSSIQHHLISYKIPKFRRPIQNQFGLIQIIF